MEYILSVVVFGVLLAICLQDVNSSLHASHEVERRTAT